MTTVAGAGIASYLLPPNYSMHIAEPQDFGALYLFAAGGVIISLLCGAAWHLRREARVVQVVQQEVTRLRAFNEDLLWRAQQQDASVRASEKLLQAFARAALEGGSEVAELAGWVARGREVYLQAVDCAPLARAASQRHNRNVRDASLPTVWCDEKELRQLLDILFRAAGRPGVERLQLGAGRMPGAWLLTATFQRSASGTSKTAALSSVELAVCEHIVVRQGGRTSTGFNASGDWEFKFMLASPGKSVERAADTRAIPA